MNPAHSSTPAVPTASESYQSVEDPISTGSESTISADVKPSLGDSTTATIQSTSLVSKGTFNSAPTPWKVSDRPNFACY